MPSTLHPRRRLLALSLLAAAGSACTAPPPPAAEKPVLNGIDVLEKSRFAALAGRKIGLITNHTGVNLRGQSTATLLHTAEGVDLRALFSPEHGFFGVGEGHIGNATHPETGLPIYSLYTAERAPNAAHLQGLDSLVFDIQDIGCRFYTYISTMGEAMQVASKQGLKFVVLDRPNPIGDRIGGPLRDADRKSFVAWHNLPVRHGMTVGELAQMFNAECAIGVDLEVIPMRGYRREMLFDHTGQTFVNPSPNMRSPIQALLYPGVGLVEFSNLSVGRGTDTPFELVGAPWLDGPALATALNRAGIPGLRCVPIRFTPRASKFKGKLCSGVRFWVTARDHFDPLRLGIELACALRHRHGDTWQSGKMIKLLAHAEVLRLIESGVPAAAITAGLRPQEEAFRKRRQPFLIY